MKVMQTPRFQRAAKKLKRSQKADLDNAIRCLIEEPDIGDVKVGDLAGIRVYKFKMTGQLTLLAYRYDDGELTLTLLMLGSHENFYRDLKR
ncbi:type II toxin-antitoxin system RelE/ParE family toxin [Modicisalibacter xianhensis]|uniref:mRNA-degrading endonuclease (mRNA interferase) YafQ, toxin component of the YafQ-DinJ toxin-antitoxin module n=1 Tax=Modicisalibacter xianhensis TaxID=442341 RepID=A0A1I3A4K4_9GAMM|nr:type II toxin-antitoxin system RelE/ParE family toxin [Halomonas xianhensis]SFH44689.1 mRNA-degrading endonuclease (mRNA interferase) YafQ, toxin component of the YafQ-DinJ toxin-antitoxin module [Halomonas xianhensis]